MRRQVVSTLLFTCVSLGWVQTTIRGLLLRAYSNKGETLTTLYLGKGELKQPLRRRKKPLKPCSLPLSRFFVCHATFPSTLHDIPKNGCEADYKNPLILEKRCLGWQGHLPTRSILGEPAFHIPCGIAVCLAIRKNEFPQINITANIFPAKIYTRVSILWLKFATQKYSTKKSCLFNHNLSLSFRNNEILAYCLKKCFSIRRTQ